MVHAPKTTASAARKGNEPRVPAKEGGNGKQHYSSEDESHGVTAGEFPSGGMG